MPVSKPNFLPFWTVASRVDEVEGRSLGVRFGLAAIRAYKVLLSPLFAGSCRFTPSCADYTSEAIGRFGLVRGSWLGLRRVCRCHPLGGHGLDPVPRD